MTVCARVGGVRLGRQPVVVFGDSRDSLSRPRRRKFWPSSLFCDLTLDEPLLCSDCASSDEGPSTIVFPPSEGSDERRGPFACSEAQRATRLPTPASKMLFSRCFASRTTRLISA